MAGFQTRGRNRKTITYLWIAALAIITIFLIYKELTAVLYILATLGVTAILLVVAFADLHGERGSADSPPAK
jgi:heme O synthase-like polyprenyltransferase